MEEKYRPTEEQLNRYFDLTDEILKDMKISEDEIFGEKFSTMWKESYKKFIDKLPPLTYGEWQFWLIMTIHTLWFTQNGLLSRINVLEDMMKPDLFDKKKLELYKENLVKEFEKQMKSDNVLTIIADACRQEKTPPNKS